MIVRLCDRAELTRDTDLQDRGGFGGITLAHNARSPEAVDAIFAEARAAGATVMRERRRRSGAGCSGVFADPDGHAWQIAHTHTPFWTIRDDGSIAL